MSLIQRMRCPRLFKIGAKIVFNSRLSCFQSTICSISLKNSVFKWFQITKCPYHLDEVSIRFYVRKFLGGERIPNHCFFSI
ncbi:hypothetical protein L596_006037 [Steinernema carpocapsae]|uniref:Uncharacterized protein n=1 Tax=Steinernema carpocapsae TaxID=34508 RepID=A0A4U8V634_STECR|nr:hypothetical protein L596_006037 [Steinernema carpocapsae]